MSGCTFFTITDCDFFPGAVAAVNSVLLYHPAADVWVVEDQRRPLTPAQRRCFGRSAHVRVVSPRALLPPGVVVDVISLKAHVALALLPRYDVLVSIDADCVLCSSLDDVISHCRETGGLAGGRAGAGLALDHRFGVYGIATPAHTPVYMSLSLFVVARTPENERLFERWVECCRAAEFNGHGSLPGASEQEILSVLMLAEGALGRVTLFPNSLWSQHFDYWESGFERQGRDFINVSAGGQRQRAFHAGGPLKFWTRAHHERVIHTHPAQVSPYVWFLAMLWFGPCADWETDPFEYLPVQSRHLLDDLVHFLPEIFQVHPPARFAWRRVSDAVIERALAGIPRYLRLGGGSLTELTRLLEAHPRVRRYVEVGSYEGGSALALGLRFLYRDIDFFAVESFTGNLDGTMDGNRLPSRRRFLEHLRRFPGLRVRLVPGESARAAALFDDRSLDFVFIDACHDTASVLADMDAWLPKLAPGGIIAGDDYSWPTVEAAVDQQFPERHITSSGALWWCPV